MRQAQARNIYKNNQILTAPQNKLIVMLYDGALKNMKLAKIAIDEKNIAQVNINLQKAQDIIMELMSTLNMEVGGEVAESLYKLYDYIYLRLITANIEKNKEYIVECEGYLEGLRDAWAKI